MTDGTLTLDHWPALDLDGGASPAGAADRLDAMVALQKWLGKHRRTKLPREPMATPAAKRYIKGVPPVAEMAVCEQRLRTASTEVLVCTSGDCEKKLPCKMGPRARARKSLNEPFVVRPVSCLGHCKHGPNVRVVHDGHHREFVALKKAKDMEALWAYARDLSDGGDLWHLSGELLKHAKGKVKTV